MTARFEPCRQSSESLSGLPYKHYPFPMQLILSDMMGADALTKVWQLTFLLQLNERKRSALRDIKRLLLIDFSGFNSDDMTMAIMHSMKKRYCIERSKNLSQGRRSNLLCLLPFAYYRGQHSITCFNVTLLYR